MLSLEKEKNRERSCYQCQSTLETEILGNSEERNLFSILSF